MMKLIEKTDGFTLIELILVVGLFTIVFSSGAIVFGGLIQRNSLNYYGNQLVQMLREARTNAVVQKNDSSWGLHFNRVIPPYSYTFFKGESYAGRDPAFDLAIELPSVVTISQFDLGGSDEFIFNKSDGISLPSGTLSLTAENNVFSISVNSLGLVDFTS
jgi:prepilin-type N-terminal cleavage/methylation domain-containing protein